ncbi:MAG TPA: C69 family dipeptidase [Acidimicrobiales bacterium]|nr:C69 family dipeptidase [Acidimicrobiales bacterium]
MVVVREDSVLFGKNSDRDPNESQLVEWHARRSTPAGGRIRCTWIDIPDVATTNAVLISRPFWMWGAEMGTNEHGVTIGNEAVFTSEPYAATGLTGMDLLRLALERADTAEHAVSVLVDLLETHGQGGGCGLERPSFTYHNSFLVADPREAWVLETAGSKWATEHVTAGVRSISNELTIPKFASRYRDRMRSMVAASRARRAATSKLSCGATVGDVMSCLRSHGRSPVPRYSILNGAMSAPCVHAGGLLAASQTTASWVGDLRDTGSQHWVTATSAPCTSLFKPVRVDTPVALGRTPGDHDDGCSLWWRHEHLHRRTMFDPAVALPLFTPERDAVERRWLADPPSSRAAFEEGDELLARWTAAVETAVERETRPWYVRRYWAARAARSAFVDRRILSA